MKKRNLRAYTFGNLRALLVRWWRRIESEAMVPKLRRVKVTKNGVRKWPQALRTENRTDRERSTVFRTVLSTIEYSVDYIDYYIELHWRRAHTENNGENFPLLFVCKWHAKRECEGFSKVSLLETFDYFPVENRIWSVSRESARRSHLLDA